MKRIGLLGGSFDPPHIGHLFVSKEAKKLLNLDEIWWLVTPHNPLKIKKPASYENRIINCKNIVKNHPIKIKEYEKLINSGYSYRTIKYLKKRYKNFKFFWLMGSDNLIYFHKWQDWKKIFNEVFVVVFKRHGYNSNALNSIAKKTFQNYSLNPSQIKYEDFKALPSWVFLQNKEVKISSSEIREKRKLLRG